jgi:hypothetical protein
MLVRECSSYVLGVVVVVICACLLTFRDSRDWAYIRIGMEYQC